MKLKRIISYILYAIATGSIFLASGIKQVKEWWDIARPFFIVSFVCIIVGLIIANLETIRRYTYPIFVCACAWSFKHKIFMTKFTRNTYRLYMWKKGSYSALFDYVQDLFDLMYN